MVSLLKQGSIVRPDINFWLGIDVDFFEWVNNREVSKSQQGNSHLFLRNNAHLSEEHFKIILTLDYASKGMVISDKIYKISRNKNKYESKFRNEGHVRSTEVLFSDIKSSIRIFVPQDKKTSIWTKHNFTLNDTEYAWKILSG